MVVVVSVSRAFQAAPFVMAWSVCGVSCGYGAVVNARLLLGKRRLISKTRDGGGERRQVHAMNGI